ALAQSFEKLRLRRYYRLVMAVLYEFNFWRGVSVGVKGRAGFNALIRDAASTPALAYDAPVVDLAQLPSPEHLKGVLQLGNQKGLRLVYNGTEFSSLPPVYGFEPLQKEHLDRVLYDRAKQQFIRGLRLGMIDWEMGGSAF